MKHLSKTGIEYGDYNWNFYPGCLHKPQGVCPPDFKCWAESMSKRQREDFHKPHLLPEQLLAPLNIKKPSRILVNFMGDLFGDWVEPNMDITQLLKEHVPDEYSIVGNWTLKESTFHIIRNCLRHTFVFLTKNPAGLLKWAPFPDNCQVGFSAWNRESLLAGCRVMQDVAARVRFVSVEPMLGDCWVLPSTLVLAGIDLVIIGAQTRPFRAPELAWLKDLVDIADKAGAKVFIKDNLYDFLMKQPHDDRFWEDMSTLRQELPE